MKRTKRYIPFTHTKRTKFITNINGNLDNPTKIYTHATEFVPTPIWPKFVIRRGRRSILHNRFQKVFIPPPFTYIPYNNDTTHNPIWPKFIIRRGRRSVVPPYEYEKYKKLFNTTTSTQIPTITKHTHSKYCNCRRSRRTIHTNRNREIWYSIVSSTSTYNDNEDKDLKEMYNQYANGQRSGSHNTAITTTYMPALNDPILDTLVRNHRVRFPGRNCRGPFEELNEIPSEPLTSVDKDNSSITNDRDKHVKHKRSAEPGLNPFSLLIINRLRNKDGSIRPLFSSQPKVTVPNPLSVIPSSTIDYDKDLSKPTIPKTSATIISPIQLQEFMKTLPQNGVDTIKKYDHETELINIDNLQEKMQNYDGSRQQFALNNMPGLGNEELKILNKRSVDKNDHQRHKRWFWSKHTTTRRPQIIPPRVPEFMLDRPDLPLDVKDKYDHEHDPLDSDQLMMSNQIKNRKRNILSNVDTETPHNQTPIVPSRENTMIIDELEDEETVLKKIKIAEEKRIESFTKWLIEFQPRVIVEYENRKHYLEQLNNEDYDKYPERKPVPLPTEYIQSMEARGVSYDDALIQWREKERAHRLWRAEVEFIAFPNRNRPDVVMEDFDLTFKDINYDFDPQFPEGTADDPTAYRVHTLHDGRQLPARKSRRNAWRERQAQILSVPVEKFQEQLLEKEILHSIESQGMIKNRKRRSVDQQTTSKVAWRCITPIENNSSALPEHGIKYLTIGGRVVEDKFDFNAKPR